MMKHALTALALTFALPACAQTSTPQTAIAPPRPEPVAEALPYSPVIVSGETIYLAGHLGFVPGTRDYPDGGIGPQTTQTLENIGATLATVGASHADLVRCQVFLSDIDDFGEMNAAYREFFPATPPARTTVAVAGLAADALIEIECTGTVGHSTPSSSD
ncbi:MAG: RidA family protein [Pseudomonadota bacterium]